MKRLYIMLAMLPLLLLSCKGGAKQEDKKAEAEDFVVLNAEQMKHVTIRTDSLRFENISSLIKVTGKIDVPPQNLISVSMPLGGYLKYTKLLPGAFVRKGEVIAVMEDQQYIQLQQDYLTAKTRLEYLRKEMRRQQDLNKSEAVSEKIMQQAETEYRTVAIQVKALEEKLQLINIDVALLNEDNMSKSVNIYATMNCYVSKINVNIGKYVNPSDVLFELINPEDIHLTLNVFEKDIVHLNLGQQLTAYSNIHPEKKYICEIIQVSRDINEEHFAEVHCHFKQYDKILLPGMYMNAEIDVKSNRCSVIPAGAVVSFEGKSYVFVEQVKGSYQLIEVKVGQTNKEVVELLDAGAIENKSIVVEGAYTLLMKLKNKE